MNPNGELGLGHFQHESSPKKINLKNVTSVVCGHGHVMALSESTIYSWGYNRNGELGIGSSQNQSSPQKVNLLHVSQIFAGGNSSFAICSTYTRKIYVIFTEDESVWSWGNNYYGELGLGKNTNQSLPQMSNLSQVETMSMGLYHVIALCSILQQKNFM